MLNSTVLDIVYLALSAFVLFVNTVFLVLFIKYLYTAKRKLTIPEYSILFLYEIVLILNFGSFIYSLKADPHSNKWKTFCVFTAYLINLVLFYFAFEMSKLRV